MSDFVEQCRREWKRLRVPAAAADEMADDLAADLAEAEADGADPEELLGDGAADPQAFAEAWARERRLVPPRRLARLRSPRALAFGVVLTVLAALAAVVAATRLSSTQPTRPANAVSVQSPHFTSVFRTRMKIIGTEVFGVRLAPSNTLLAPRDGRVMVIRRLPTMVAATIKNSGETLLPRVEVVVAVAGRGYARTTSALRPGSQRTLHFRLPSGLPDRFVLRVRTVPVQGETNASNNQASWRIRVRS